MALSGLYEVNKDLSITLDYYGLRTKDEFPDLGGYLIGAVPNRVPATNVPVYAQTSDFLKSDVDTVTARVNWKLAPNMRLTSLTRYGKSDNGYVTTGANAGTRYDGATGAGVQHRRRSTVATAAGRTSTTSPTRAICASTPRWAA